MNIFDKYFAAVERGDTSTADYIWAVIAYYYFNDREPYEKFLFDRYGVKYKKLFTP